MRSLDYDPDSNRLEDAIDRVRNLSSHSFLNLKTFRVCVDKTGKFTDSDDSRSRNIGHPHLSDDRRHVMLAVAFEWNASQSDRTLISSGFAERGLQEGVGITTVTRKILPECPYHSQ